LTKKKKNIERLALIKRRKTTKPRISAMTTLHYYSIKHRNYANQSEQQALAPITVTGNRGVHPRNEHFYMMMYG
jgi:hypothetical protein